jgi:2,4-dienoyl-CoA reductase-like NADH-dependent reductase (Old Yellow Enzyme family)
MSAVASRQMRTPVTPGYNVDIAVGVRATGIATRMIVPPQQAEAIVADGKADMVALARTFIDEPHWRWHAAQTLGAEVKRPLQYRAPPRSCGRGRAGAVGGGVCFG